MYASIVAMYLVSPQAVERNQVRLLVLFVQAPSPEAEYKVHMCLAKSYLPLTFVEVADLLDQDHSHEVTPHNAASHGIL